MNRRDGSDFQTAVLDSSIQKGLVLVVVGVHFACIKREVRAHVVGKLNDFEVVAVLFQIRLDELQNIGVGHRGCRHAKFFSARGCGTQTDDHRRGCGNKGSDCHLQYSGVLCVLKGQRVPR